MNPKEFRRYSLFLKTLVEHNLIQSYALKTGANGEQPSVGIKGINAPDWIHMELYWPDDAKVEDSPSEEL